MSLPPLPEMQHIMIRGIATGILTEAQTKAYGQACREAALEEAINCYSPDDTASSYIEKIEDLK